MKKQHNRLANFAVAYSEQSEELVIPSDLSTLSVDELSALKDSLIEVFDAMAADEGTDIASDEVQATLAGMAENIEALAAEITVREEANAEKAAKVAELAEKVNAFRANTEDDGADTDEGDTDEEDDADAEDTQEEEPETDKEDAAHTESLSAGKRSEFRVNLSNVKRPAPKVEKQETPKIEDYATSTETSKPMSWEDMGKAIDAKLNGYNHSQYQSAAHAGRKMKEQFGIAAFDRKIPKELMVTNFDPEQTGEIIKLAVDQSRLPGGSLVAAGGWCAPSETLYDFFSGEATDEGLLSLPEVGIRRGGIKYPVAPSFAEIYEDITGWNVSEQEAIDGKYVPGASGNVVGEKPCYHIDCPDFKEERLRVEGMCLTAGLLARKGYPEYIARVVRGAMVAQLHRTNARVLAAVGAGSVQVDITAEGGVAAPALNAIELVAQEIREKGRLRFNQPLEAVFPFWVKGVIRADLAYRGGVDMLSVTDAQIDGWFRQRFIVPQFVYDWGLLSGTTPAVKYPQSVTFLLYEAGTWFKGTADVLTVDTLYDSTLLSQNDYTALWTEDGYLVGNRGGVSRVVSVTNVCPDGSVGAAKNLCV